MINPTVTRRATLAGAGALGLAAATRPARAQSNAPLKVGFLTVKTGPLASGGIQEEQGVALFLQDRKMTLAGRPVQLFTADTGGTPANTRTKAQELVERDGVAVIIGPLASVEALAINDYIREKQIPVICEAAAEDITQRTANPWVVRVTSSSAQCTQPLADFARKELKYNRMALIGDDFAFGHEQNAGFQRVFEEEGGKVVQKLWPPLNAPDYGTYIAQLKTDIDAIFMSFAGSNGLKFFKSYKEYGGDKPILGGMTAVDELTLQQMGDDAVGLISANFYSAQLDNPENKKFVAEMMRQVQSGARLLRSRLLRRRPRARGRARKDQGQHRGQAGVHGRAARAQDRGQHSRTDVARQIWQRHWQHLRSQGREEERSSRQLGHQDLS